MVSATPTNLMSPFCQDRSYTNILYLAVSLFSSELHLPCPQKDVLRPSVKKLRCPHAGIKNRKNIAISLDFSSLGDILSGKRNGFGRSGEMADALDSKSGASNGMRVRVPPSAPFIFKDLQNCRSFFYPFARFSLSLPVASKIFLELRITRKNPE